MEIFTFLRMGGTLDRVIAIPLIEATNDDEPIEAMAVRTHQPTALRELFGSFHVDRCECFKPEDRQHLLAVIESGFGGLEPFNHLVRTMFEMCRRLEFASEPISGSGCEVAAVSGSQIL